MRRLALLVAILPAALLLVVLAGFSSSGGSARGYRIRAIFDDAAFAVRGEEVRIAGATVGSIQDLGVTPDKKAAVTLAVNDSRFTPFHADATCAIRPQSLIGEEYVDCSPGTSATGSLGRISQGAGAGTYLLPVSQTTSPVDSDIVQGIYREPIRQRFALIIDELGTGLAARGSDLNAVIHRANPALADTDRVLKILAGQNRALAQLTADSDTVLAPLAKARSSISGFIVQANTTSAASASRSADIARSIHLFPGFLQALRPLMDDLGRFADQGTPLMAEQGQSASALGRQFQNLIPFAQAARPALIALGASSRASQPALLATIPLANRLRNVGAQGVPTSTYLDQLTASLDGTGAIEQLMTLLFNGTSATNGFDARGHYVRTEPLTGSCTTFQKAPIPGCAATFGSGASAAAASAGVASLSPEARRLVVKAASPDEPSPGTLKALLSYLTANR